MMSDNIRNSRVSKKLTQQQLADKAGVDARYIRKLESGTYEPDFSLVRIAKVLGVKLEKLLTNAK